MLCFIKVFLLFPVICRELGSKEREIMKEMAEIAKEGFLLKQQLIQEAKSGLEEKKVQMERKLLVFYEKSRSRVLTHGILQCQICFYADTPTLGVYISSCCMLLVE